MQYPTLRARDIMNWGFKALEDFGGKSDEDLAGVARQCEMYEGRLSLEARDSGLSASERDERMRGSVRCTVRKTIALALKEGRIDVSNDEKGEAISEETLRSLLQPILDRFLGS